MAEDVFEFGERLLRVLDLDRAHAHRTRRLQIYPEIVEEHRLVRRDADGLAGDLVEARIGLADTDLAGFHDGVTERHRFVDRPRLIRRPRRRPHIVGAARYPVPLSPG